MWVFFLFTAVQVQAVCPVYQCSQLTGNICISWTTDLISINSSGCSDITTTCSMSQALLSYKKSPAAGSYSCTSSSSSDTMEEGFMNCGDRESGRDLKEGSHPKLCTKPGEDDESCLLEDYSYSECKCGLDAKAYCKPNPSESPFDNYWRECDDLDNIVNSMFFNYYDLLHSYYVEYASAPNCANEIFNELIVLNESIPESSNAGWIVIGSALLIVFI